MFVAFDGVIAKDAKGEFKQTHCVLQDITEKRQTEQSLCASEEKFRFLFDNMTQGVVVMAADGNIIEANEAAGRILGLSTDQLLGKTSMDPRWRAVHEDGTDWPGQDHPGPASLKTGKAIRETVQGVFDPDGNKYRWIIVSATPRFKPGDKKPCEAVVTFTDITDRMRANAKLRESETKYRNLFSNMREALAFCKVVYDKRNRVADWIYLDVNDAYLRITGLTDVKGHRLSEIMPGFKKGNPEMFKALATAAATGQPAELESYLKPIDIRVHASIFSPAKDQFVAIFEDITARYEADVKLNRQTQTIKGIINSTGGPVFSLDKKYRYTSFNETHAAVMKQLYGAKLELGKNMLDYMTVAADRKAAKANVDKALAGERVIEEAFSGEEGRRTYFEVSHNPIEGDVGKIIGVGIMVRDLTEKRAAEIALKESESRYRGLFGNMLEGFAFCRAIYDKKGRLTDWVYLDANLAFEKITGLKKVVGKKITDILPNHRKENPELFELYEGVLKSGKPTDIESYVEPLNEWLHISVFSPAKDHFVAIFEDITDKRIKDNALRESEERTRSVIDNAPFGAHLYSLEPDGRLVYVAGNASADRILGINCDQFIGMTLEEAFPGNIGTEIPEMYRRAAKTGEPYSTQQVTYSEGTISGIFEVHAVQTAPNHMVAFFRDVTAAQRAQVMLQHSEERYRSIFDHANEGIVRTTLPNSDIVTVNQRFADMTGYDSPAQLIKEVRYFKNLYANMADREPLIAALQEHGIVTNKELRLKRRDGSQIWISVNISVSKDEGGNDVFLDGLVADITNRKFADIELRESKKSLEQALAGLISTLALTVETRDPYTAEHQKRVTDIAVAIAKKAGLSEQEIYGLEMAAAIHDVGKIYVPAETLNKPGKITSVEFELVKTHAAAGHNIVKDIEFGQPISEIILQHHERFDGSGYPDGLKGEEIHKRARILAIADVVEAMTSHRPYRAAFTIKEALNEIEQGSGTLYDPEYATICIDLFRSGAFNFK